MPYPAQLFVALLERGWRPHSIDAHQATFLTRTGRPLHIPSAPPATKDVQDAQETNEMNDKKETQDPPLPRLSVLHTFLARGWTLKHVDPSHVCFIRGPLPATTSEDVPVDAVVDAMAARGYSQSPHSTSVLLHFYKSGKMPVKFPVQDGHVPRQTWAETEGKLSKE